MLPFALANLLDSMDFDQMDDTGMWIWAGILTLVTLVVSFGVAIWWQRARGAKKEE